MSLSGSKMRKFSIVGRGLLLAVLLVFAFGPAYSQSKLPDTENCDFLAVSPDSTICVLFKYLDDSDSDFAEGNVMLYNLLDNSIHKLNDEVFVREFTKCEWRPVHGTDVFLLSDDAGIELYSVKSGKKKLLVPEHDNQMVYDFSLSNSGDEIAYCMLEREGSGNSFQKIYIMNLKTGKKRSVMSFQDPDMGGGLYMARVRWSITDDCLYVVNELESKLYSISIKTGDTTKVDNGVVGGISMDSRSLLPNDKGIYYPKEKALFVFDKSSGKTERVLDFKEKVKIHALGKAALSRLFVSFNNNLLRIDPAKKEVRLVFSRRGAIVEYCNNGFIILKYQNALWKLK